MRLGPPHPVLNVPRGVRREELSRTPEVRRISSTCARRRRSSSSTASSSAGDALPDHADTTFFNARTRKWRGRERSSRGRLTSSVAISRTRDSALVVKSVTHLTSLLPRARPCRKRCPSGAPVDLGCPRRGVRCDGGPARDDRRMCPYLGRRHVPSDAKNDLMTNCPCLKAVAPRPTSSAMPGPKDRSVFTSRKFAQFVTTVWSAWDGIVMLIVRVPRTIAYGMAAFVSLNTSTMVLPSEFCAAVAMIASPSWVGVPS
jgi:hypothetical protein